MVLTKRGLLCLVFIVKIVSACDVDNVMIMAITQENFYNKPLVGTILNINDLTKEYMAGIVTAEHLPVVCKQFISKTQDLLFISFIYVNINSFETGIFDGSLLQNLSFGNTELSEINSGTFSNMPSIKELLFRNNAIKTIHHGAFNNLPQLETLEVSYAKLETIRSNWFINCPRLQKVDFSYNNIKIIQTGAFDFLTPALPNSIIINNNKIRTMHYAAFTTNKFNLLDLEGNRLSSLSSKIFPNLQRSARINLKDNRFDCVNDNTLEILKLFAYVNLDDNSIEDNCDKEIIIKQLIDVAWN